MFITGIIDKYIKLFPKDIVELHEYNSKTAKQIYNGKYKEIKTVNGFIMIRLKAYNIYRTKFFIREYYPKLPVILDNCINEKFDSNEFQFLLEKAYGSLDNYVEFLEKKYEININSNE